MYRIPSISCTVLSSFDVPSPLKTSQRLSEEDTMHLPNWREEKMEAQRHEDSLPGSEWHLEIAKSGPCAQASVTHIYYSGTHISVSLL